MKVPIPGNWDRKSWICIKLQWPDDDEFFSLFTGLLTIGTRGRYWDEKTGSIRDIQSQWWQIFDKNRPLLLCDGTTVEPPPVTYWGGSSDCEDDMGCVLPPGVIRVNEAGVLQYLTCEGWRNVEGWDGSVITDPPPENEELDPVAGYACNKAYGMAQVFATEALAVLGQLQTYPDVTNRLRGIRYVLRSYSITWSEAQAMITAYNADPSGIAENVESVYFADWLTCLWSSALENTSDLSATEFQQMGASLAYQYDVATRQFLIAVLDGIGQASMAWFARVSYDETADCTCPDVESGETDPSANGWYWGAPIAKSFEYKDSFENTYAISKITPPHDVYGVAVQIQTLSSPANLNKFKRSSTEEETTFDVWMFGTNSDSWSSTWEDWHCQVDPDIAVEVMALLDGTPQNHTPQFASVETINTPSATPDDVVLATYNFGSASGDHTGTLLIRWLHNTGSPSHL